MSRIVFADYDPETKTLTLRERLEGVSTPDEVSLQLASPNPDPSHDETRGILKGEAGDELAAIVEEMFPTEK
ncbi:MAG TPA: hypothetical protein VF787_12895 [Thermoanaerobaculia bacterium]